MESYRIRQEGGPRDTAWVLACDGEMLTLDAPDGERVLKAPITEVHRLVGLYDLYAEGKVRLATSRGSLVFREQSDSEAAAKRWVEAGMAADPEFCADLRRQSLGAIRRGLVMFLVGGGLFGLYCWYASWAPEPPPEHWIRRLKWPIHGVLLLLLGLGLSGPLAAYFGLMQLSRVRRIERQAAAHGRRVG